ncbi:MAG: putative hydrolase of the HAD superfamily [Candidatus Electronema aureum]|uniref:Hydrolase of the HAD superfamily n=1 Tax=Candidatus Electronema aureum TaxID=2005002 RepID=A0A521G0Y4_9BACT|nr:MAG: putative hydrolase of the HAD superfamily [Candidatus Electronema aureum]
MHSSIKISAHVPWDAIDTVMLDMDGTLLDKHFDDYFWEVYLPEHYSLVHDISVEEAAIELMERYRQAENSLQWSDIEHWSRELNLDIPELKMRIDHLIDVHPHVPEFLAFCRKLGKKLYLVTNAHPRTLAIKLDKADIGAYFDRLICADEVGFAKEEPQFWHQLQELLQFDPARSLLADDTQKVLRTAEKHGIGCLIHIARPSSRRPVSYSAHYPSIDSFNELIAESNV